MIRTQPPPFPEDEILRLKSLHDHALLDTTAEERFDRITRLAQRMFGVPIALVSLIDAERQWFKSRQGLDACETGRDISFCGYAILDREIFHIPDASLDPRFSGNPLVLGPPHIRFYAGAPLTTSDGYRIGTLCIIGDKPRQLTQAELASLRDLADGVEIEINRRYQERKNDALLALNEITSLPTLDHQSLLRAALQLGCRYLDLPVGIISHINGEVYEIEVQSSPPDTLNDGQQFPLGQTYCSIALRGDKVLAIDHMGLGDYADHPCYRAFKLESYIGTRLLLDDKVYGTLNFSSAEPRTSRRFSEAEIEFMELLARWVATTLRHWKLGQELKREQGLRDAITRAQSVFIGAEDRHVAFEGLLGDMLQITGSEYGFIGEILHTAGGVPYLKSYAITNISWSDETRAYYEENVSKGMEFFNLNTLFGAAITSGMPIIANTPSQDPRSGGLPAGHPPLNAFLGIPIYYENKLVALTGLANRQGGYDQALVDYLNPLTLTIAQLVQAARVQKQHRKDQVELARLSRVASQTTNGVIITDIEGRAEWINEGFSRITGYTLEEMRGRKPGHLLQGEATDPKVVASISEALAQQKHFDVELINYSKTGLPFWVQISCNPLLDAAGNLQGFMAIESDVSERKRMERMKGEFVSTVSHELRTPLTAISGALGLLAGGALGGLTGNIKKMVDIAQQNSQRLTFMINDLLDIEKLTAGKMDFDMQIQALMPLVEQAIEGNRTYVGDRHVRMHLTHTADVAVRVDNQRLLQVMANLLSNAIKFSPDDGSIELAVQAIDQTVQISVTDHGPGIPAVFHPRIFQKFAQADSSDTRQKGGTGLGLAITQQLVERMGGRIGFDSTEGKGATFYIEFPVAPAAT
ncbi:MAG TPA: GAF domain-containing protein [Gallionellaceae bacterium]|nr:GAF domain-containing protein [Gallionellaceae bacterium]HQS75345.1 GAF domain-containing protein [Gallionellaceae bacterium]